MVCLIYGGKEPHIFRKDWGAEGVGPGGFNTIGDREKPNASKRGWAISTVCFDGVGS